MKITYDDLRVFALAAAATFLLGYFVIDVWSGRNHDTYLVLPQGSTCGTKSLPSLGDEPKLSGGTSAGPRVTAASLAGYSN